MNNYKPYQIILLLTPFVFSFAFGLDIYIPIVPQMTEIFQTTPAMIQLTLSLFLFFTGLGQLFIGPLSDRFGRQTIFTLSSLIYGLGSLACAFSSTVGYLIFSRIVCSIGACGMLVTSFAVIRDLYSQEKSAKMYSYLNGGIGVSPTFAPILGGYLAFYYGWYSVFFFLAAIGFFSLFISRKFIGETHPKENRISLDKAIFNRYRRIFSNRQLIVFSLISGFAEGVFFSFFSISPFIIIGLLGVPTHEFGYYFAAFGSVIALGGIASGKIVEKLGIQSTIMIGISLMLFGGISMLLWFYIGGLSLSGFLIPMVIACTGAMFLVGASASAALEPFGDIAGTASAAFGALQFSLSALVGYLLMFFPVSSTIPYGVCIILMAILSLSCFSLRKTRKSGALETN